MDYSAMVKRITISLNEKLLKWIDDHIDGYRFKDRSHLIQVAIIDLMNKCEKEKSSD